MTCINTSEIVSDEEAENYALLMAGYLISDTIEGDYRIRQFVNGSTRIVVATAKGRTWA